MFLIPHLLCLLGLLALGTVHTSPLTENEILPLDTVDAAASAEVVKLQHGSCSTFWFSFNGHSYKYVSADMSWGEAERNCVSQGANLVSVHSTGEHNFVQTLIRNFDPREGATWIGLSDIHWEDSWLWSDGSKVSFTKWNAGEPNNANGGEDCVYCNGGEDCVFTTYGNNWNDYHCDRALPSVCKARTDSSK